MKTRYKVVVGTIEGAPVLSQNKCDRKDGRDEGRSQTETGHRQPGAVEVKTNSLLLKEFDESNNWARLVLQLYFAWFGLQFTVNGVGLGWLLGRTGPKPWFSNLISLVFIGWNLMGTIGTMMVYKGLAAGDRRMKQLMDAMANSDQTDQRLHTPRSPMPLSAIGTVFGFCVFTLFISLFFWIVMFVAA